LGLAATSLTINAFSGVAENAGVENARVELSARSYGAENSPFPFAVAVNFRTPLPLPLRIFMRLRQLFAVHDSNGTEFSYVIFAEQRNFTTAQRRNGNA